MHLAAGGFSMGVSSLFQVNVKNENQLTIAIQASRQ